jgi:hydroxypyruvate isomerase
MASQKGLSRREASKLVGAGVASAAMGRAAAAPVGRLKQSVARWCYDKIPLDDFCRQAAEMGLVGVDLVEPEEWPTLRKYSLIPTMTQGKATIPDGWNRVESHARLEGDLRERIALAAENKVPNVIVFSGNRRGISEEQGRDNCILGLRRAASFAEEHGITLCLELLNSKVDHPDYQCDHTRWGVEVVKGVGSPRLKLLYDIYHMQIMEGDVIRTIRDNIQYIGHFHTGGVPGRHELDENQELQWRTIAKAIADLKFDGYFAHEFVPSRDPLTSLRQAVELCTV